MRMGLELNGELNAKTAWITLRKRVEGFGDRLALGIGTHPRSMISNSGLSGSWWDNSINFRSIIR